MQGIIRNAHNERIDYTFHDAPGNETDIVIIGHGVGLGLEISEWLAASRPSASSPVPSSIR